MKELICSICGKWLNSESTTVDIFEPKVKIQHLFLCRSCNQSLQSWMENRQKKKLTYPVTHGPHDCGCDD